MPIKQITILTLLCFFFYKAPAQRTVAECTITYTLQATGSIDTALQKSLLQTLKTVYIKGNSAKIAMQSPNYFQATIFDKINGKATIIREIGGNKFLTKLTANQWLQQNKQYNNSKLVITDSVKKIIGYDCKMATLHLENQSSIQLFYIPTLNSSVKEGEWQFKDVPGLVLEYTVNEKGINIIYTANKISFNPVPASIFVIPTKGYRLL